MRIAARNNKLSIYGHCGIILRNFFTSKQTSDEKQAFEPLGKVLIDIEKRRNSILATLTYAKAIILGLVQGLAEFLPISSSGHLALLQHFFGISGDDVLVFTVLLHMGTLVSVFIVYWKDIFRLIFELCYCIRDIARGRGPRFYSNPTRKLGVMIIVATIPTAIIGLLLNDTFEGLYSNILAIGIALIITGTILWIADRFGRNDKHIREMTLTHAVVVGTMQGLAIAPGISRSGSTLFGGLISGLERDFAVKFAFLISIPSILGSFVLEIPDALKSGTEGLSAGPVIVGVIVSAISGLVAIKAMIKIVSNKKLTIFSFYTWTLGIIVVVYAIVKL